MKTAIIWFLLTAVPVLGSLRDYNKNEKPKKKHQISQEININDTLNIEKEWKKQD